MATPNYRQIPTLRNERSKVLSIRVHTLDGIVTVMSVDESHTVLEVTRAVCSRIGISNCGEFSLTLDNGSKGGNPKQKKKVSRDKFVWLEPERTLREQGVIETTDLTLRNMSFSGSSVDITNLVQLNLIYIQSRDAILNSTHPCTKEEAILLAALQCHIQYGKHDGSRHFSTTKFLPNEYIGIPNMEQCVWNEYKKLQSLTEPDAKVAYINQCHLSPTYGFTFFLVNEKTVGKMKFVPRLLGIGKDAIMTLDVNTKQILQTWPLNAVHNWAPGHNTFSLKLRGNVIRVFKTTEGEEISRSVENYIKIAQHYIKKSMSAAGLLSEAEESNDTDGSFMMENCEVYAVMASQEHGGTITPPLQLSPNCERNVTVEEISGPKIDVLRNTSFVPQDEKIALTSSVTTLPNEESSLCSSSIRSKGKHDSPSDLTIPITQSTPPDYIYDEIDAVYYSHVPITHDDFGKHPDKPIDAAGCLIEVDKSNGIVESFDMDACEVYALLNEKIESQKAPQLSLNHERKITVQEGNCSRIDAEHNTSIPPEAKGNPSSLFALSDRAVTPSTPSDYLVPFNRRPDITTHDRW